jgi:quercetin dioxygenase-like cupin family protein
VKSVYGAPLDGFRISLYRYRLCLPNHFGGTGMVRATAHVQIENDRVRVTEWRFAPGAETGHHVHEHDYVVVPLTSGTLRLEEPAGTRTAQLLTGVAYAREKGVAHNVINANDYEFRFLEIELLEERAAI